MVAQRVYLASLSQPAGLADSLIEPNHEPVKHTHDALHVCIRLQPAKLAQHAANHAMRDARHLLLSDSAARRTCSAGVSMESLQSAQHDDQMPKRAQGTCECIIRRRMVSVHPPAPRISASPLSADRQAGEQYHARPQPPHDTVSRRPASRKQKAQMRFKKLADSAVRYASVARTVSPQVMSAMARKWRPLPSVQCAAHCAPSK